MKTGEMLLWGALGATIGLYLFSRTSLGESALNSVSDTVGDTVTSITSAVRGIRNNNPGNIRKSAEKWQGLSPTQTDGAFFQFENMPYGIRAMTRILRNYSTKYNLNTVQDIINRWAPPVENNTTAYVNAVADAVGVSSGEFLNLDNADTMFNLVRAIIAHENGRIAAALVPDSQVWQGINLA